MAEGVQRREDEKAGDHGAEQQRENRHEHGLRVGRDVTGVVAQVLLLGGAASVGGRTLIITLASILSLAPVPALACVTNPARVRIAARSGRAFWARPRASSAR